MFEMLAGYPPFYDPNPLDIHRKIAIGYFEFPEVVIMQARELIAGLLNQDITQRLGCLSKGAEDIKQCQWFLGVDWEIVQQKRI